MGVVRRGGRLLEESWRMLMRDKRLLAFPIVSGIALMLLVALFVVPLFVSWNVHDVPEGPVPVTPSMYGAMFVFYFLAYFVAIFCNAALVACVLRRMDGERPTLGYGVRVAWLRLPQICGWALVASTAGVLLQMFATRVKFLGRIVVGLLGAAWAVTTFLVVPVLVIEGTGPIASYRRSLELLKQTWGENLAGTVGLGTAFALAVVVPLLVVMPVTAMIGPRTFLAGVAFIVVYLGVMGVAKSALLMVYRLAVYRYAVSGEVPDGFDAQTLAEAFHEKPPKG